MIPKSHVYLMAFACEPQRGSEPGVGMSFAAALASHANASGRSATVVTRAHRVGEIRSALRESGLAGHVEILPVHLPRWVVAITGRDRVRIAYLIWQLIASMRVRSLISERGERAIVHHVTFATEGLPSFEWLIGRKAARIYGPAGSSEATPAGSDDRNLRASARHWFRATMARLNLRGAALAIAQNRHVLRTWEQYDVPSIVEPNIALRDLPTIERDQRDPHGLVSLGRLIERKQHHRAIDVLRHLPHDYTLKLIGGGPLLGELRAHAESNGVLNRVTFMGSMARSEALEQLGRASFLLHMSRQEGAPWAVGEAQALGVYPIATAGSGADDMIELANLGSVVDSPSSAAEVILRQDGIAAPASTRWQSERLPRMLESWYAGVDAAAGPRHARE